MSRVPVVIVGVLLLSSFGSCSGVDPEVLAIESRPATESVVSATTELARANDLRRRVKEDPLNRLREALAAAERARAIGGSTDAERKDILTRCAELAFELGSLIGDTDPKAADLLATYEKSKNYAFECLLLVPEFKAAMEQKKNKVDQESAQLVPKEYASVLLLMASAWGRSVELRGTFAQMADHGKLVLLAERALALDETVQYAGPHRFFGAYYAQLPGIAGGDMKRSRKHFDRAIEISPDFLENHVMLAEDWALEEGDLALARREIDFVLARTIADDDPLWFDQTQAQSDARRVAEKLAQKK